MTARKRAEKLAKKLNADMDVSRTGSVFTILIDAPDGHVWQDGACLGMRIEARPTTAQDREELFEDAIRRMECGLMEEDDDC